MKKNKSSHLLNKMDSRKKIKFKNDLHPKSSFDIVVLEELFNRNVLDHKINVLHEVDFYIIFLVIEGKGKHTIDFTDYTIKKGTILTIRKDQIHKFILPFNIKGYLLLFKDDFLVSYLEDLEAKKSLQLFNELLSDPKFQLDKKQFQVVEENIGRIRNEYFHRMDDYSLSIIRSELHILISQLYRIKSKRKNSNQNKKYLSDFIKFQNLVENNVSSTRSVKDFANMMAVSTKTINNVSRSILNISAKEFIDEICIKQIKRLLINTNLTITEIAYKSGFEETTNFYKYFKRHTNNTPEGFRASK